MSREINLNLEEISEDSIFQLTEMIIKLLPESNYEEEYHNCLKIEKSGNQDIFVAKVENEYIGFIQLTVRTDYVEGVRTSPVVYVEGLYVEPSYRKNGIAYQLVKKAENWGRANNCNEIASDAELQNENRIGFHKSVLFIEANRVVCFFKKIDA